MQKMIREAYERVKDKPWVNPIQSSMGGTAGTAVNYITSTGSTTSYNAGNLVVT